MRNLDEGEVTQSCLTLCDLMDYSLPGSSVHRIFQAGVLEWVAISYSVLHIKYLELRLVLAYQDSINVNYY